MALGLIAGVQLAILIAKWLCRTPLGEHARPRQYQQTQPVIQQDSSNTQVAISRSVEPKAGSARNALSPPNPIIKDLYLEITNIAQGANIALLVYVITTRSFLESWISGYFSTVLFAATSLLIVIIFWARYYLDTEILHRSFTVLATFWFFTYVVTQGISISLISTPWAWLAGTGVFLFFGSGFYVLNLREIRRKQRAGIMPEWPDFVNWQAKRLIELAVLSLSALFSAFLVARKPVLALPAGICAFAASIWQLAITGDYRRLAFLKTGV